MSSLPPEDPALWYEDKVRRYGYDHRGLGFRNKSSQEKRFEALLALGDFDGSRVLDVGCGFGDFLAHQPDENYDYVVASGLFGLDSQGARERIRPTLERLFGWCRIGAAAN